LQRGKHCRVVEQEQERTRCLGVLEVSNVRKMQPDSVESSSTLGKKRGKRTTLNSNLNFFLLIIFKRDFFVIDYFQKRKCKTKLYMKKKYIFFFDFDKEEKTLGKIKVIIFCILLFLFF